MNKFTVLVLIITMLMTSFLFAPSASADNSFDYSQVKSESYVVIDADSGRVLIGKNIHQKMFPASITKVLTSALALEKGGVDNIVTFGETTAADVSPEGTHIWLVDGEQLSVNDALHATMITSANDASNLLAEYVSGSVAEFAKLMNDTAKQAGAFNSNFTNSHGLPDDEHYTTAYDMALITKYALTVPGFEELFGALEYEIPQTNMNSARRMGTYHHMIVESAYEYQGAIGGKLGWTPEAGHTIVTLAERDGRRLIAVAMKTVNKWDKYNDTAYLFDYCFENFHKVIIQKEAFQTFTAFLADGNHISGQIIDIQMESDVEILIENWYTADDLFIDYRVRGGYNLQQEISPTITFELPGQGGQILELPFPFVVTERAVRTDSAFMNTASKSGRDNFLDTLEFTLVWGSIAACIMIAMVLSAREINVIRYEKRRLKRKQMPPGRNYWR